MSWEILKLCCVLEHPSFPCCLDQSSNTFFKILKIMCNIVLISTGCSSRQVGPTHVSSINCIFTTFVDLKSAYDTYWDNIGRKDAQIPSLFWSQLYSLALILNLPCTLGSSNWSVSNQMLWFERYTFRFFSIFSPIVLLQVIAYCVVLLGVISKWPCTEAGEPLPAEAQFLTMTQFRKINPDIVSELEQRSLMNN